MSVPHGRNGDAQNCRENVSGAEIHGNQVSRHTEIVGYQLTSCSDVQNATRRYEQHSRTNVAARAQQNITAVEPTMLDFHPSGMEAVHPKYL